MDKSSGNGVQAPGAPSVRVLTRRLIDRVTPVGRQPDHRALAVHAACERTYRELSRSLGVSGAEALVVRAMRQSQIDHPLLSRVRIGRLATPDTEGVREMIAAHGDAAVTAALEATLDAWLTLLVRLIGEDMVARLVEQSTPVGAHDDGSDQ